VDLIITIHCPHLQCQLNFTLAWSHPDCSCPLLPPTGIQTYRLYTVDCIQHHHTLLTPLPLLPPAGIKKDSKVDGAIIAASALADAQAGGEGLSILMSGTMSGTVAPQNGHFVLGPLGYEELEEEEEEEDIGGGFEMIPAPLPPPPSCEEEVAHWTRAMFTDASRQQVAQAGANGGRHVAQMASAAGQMIGAEKLKQLFGRP
jgi:hypothetical protein